MITFLSTTSLDSTVTFFTFGIFVGFDDGISQLNQKKIQITVSTGIASEFHLLVVLIILRAVAITRDQMFCGGK